MLRWRHEWNARDDGDLVHDSGGDLITLGLNLAFRPQPSLDFQLSVEVPVFQKVNGTQLEEDISFFFAFGYRI